MIITYFPSIYNFDPWNISECKTIGLSHIYTENYRIELCALLLWFLIVSWLRLLIASVTHKSPTLLKRRENCHALYF